MENLDLINDFQEERECLYKGERYSVRDNGAVFRHRKEGGNKRPLDEFWTFGKENKNGYMYLSDHRIHIIVAIAFLGVRDSKVYVVDHIDTIRRNNRVENLRWLTRLENVLLNEFTYNKVLFLCNNDINKFLEDPSILRELANDNPNYDWMKTVSKEEARNAYENIKNLQRRKSKEPILYDKKVNNGNPPNMEWIYNKPSHNISSYEYERPEYTKALRPENVLQKNWSTPTEFLCCPEHPEGNALTCYMNSLCEGIQFSQNRYCEAYVKKFGLTKDGKGLIILCKMVNSAKDYALVKVAYIQNQYIHENKGSFFEEKGEEKYFTLECGEDWTGGDCVDDFC